MYTLEIKRFGKWQFVGKRDTLQDARTLAVLRGLNLALCRIICPDGKVWNAWGVR